jgi:Mg-chelatase subunit ChlD
MFEGIIVLRIKNSTYKLLLLLIVGFILILRPESLRAAGNKDVILVLDTSLSMVGYQGKNIFDSVKASVNQYIDSSIQDGDRVTFITFDEDVKVYPQVIIDDRNDRDIVKKYISVTKAEGKWTHTLKMLKVVFTLADQLTRESAQKANELKRNVVIVIMSDGLDDPPPDNRKESFNLKAISQQYSGNDWWIYLVNLQELQKSKEISAALGNLKNELSKISANTQMLDGTDPDKAINEQLRKDVERKERQQLYKLLSVIAVLFILLVIIILIVMKLTAIKIKGRLEYWNHELLKPDVLSLSLTNLGKKQIFVGRTHECMARIREYESRFPFSLKAVRKKGKVLIKLDHNEGLEIGFKNREADGYLIDGDIFSASNISFRYIAE